MNLIATARIGDRVSFRISDVYLPEPHEVLASLTPEVRAQGIVIEFSDSGEQRRAYALVQITNEQSVLLPLGALQVVTVSDAIDGSVVS